MEAGLFVCPPTKKTLTPLEIMIYCLIEALFLTGLAPTVIFDIIIISQKCGTGKIC